MQQKSEKNKIHGINKGKLIQYVTSVAPILKPFPVFSKYLKSAKTKYK